MTESAGDGVGQANRCGVPPANTADCFRSRRCNTILPISRVSPSRLSGEGTGAAGGWGAATSTDRARSLRRMSPPEARLWVLLRTPPFERFHFRRPVPLGRTTPISLSPRMAQNR